MEFEHVVNPVAEKQPAVNPAFVYNGKASDLLVFAYAGNMHPEQLRRRIGRVPEARILALENRALGFFGRCGRWDGGRPSAIESPGHRLWGLGYALSAGEKESLDAWQGARMDGSGLYFHIPTWAVDAEGGKWPVVFYRLSSEREKNPPSTEYLNYVVEAARLRSLPAEAQDSLKAIASAPAGFAVPRESRLDPSSLLVDCSSCSHD